MSTEAEGTAAKGMFGKLVPGVVALAGAAVGLLFATKPQRLRDAVSELPGTARDLVGDLAQRTGVGEQSDLDGQQARQEIPAHFETRRRERSERRERRRQHATK